MLVNRHPWSPSDRKGCHSVWRFASGEKGVGYLACGGGGVARLDLSEPAWAEVDARISTEGYVRDVVVLDDASGVSKPSSKTIAAANGMKGLAIVDFSAPKPKLVATTDLGGEARALAVHNGHAFVAAGAAGLVIVDVRKPTEPTVVARLMPKTTDMARGISLSENLALLCLGDSGLVVIDVSDPARPKELGRFDPARALNRVTVRGNEIFAANDADGVAILDLSNPAKPTQVYPKTQ